MSSATTIGPGPDTLGSLAAEVTRWLRGDLLSPAGQLSVRDAINDAIQDIWMEMMRWKLNRFMGSDSPVTFQLAQNVERQTFVSVPDPTVGPGFSGFVTQGNLPARTYNAALTLVTESGSETNISPITGQAMLAGQLAIFIGPNFPVGQIAAGGTINESPLGPPPPGCVGWNLYIAIQGNNPAPTPLVLVNQQPIPFGATYTEPLTGFQLYPISQQLAPTSNSTADNISWITHMETTLPDGTHWAWNQSDIDGNVMRRLARLYPNASQYQTYAWDLINGNQFEIRPQTGIAFSPRYWYVAKPRRLRYDQALIPYTSIAGVHDFIVFSAVSLCKLSLEEYIAQQAWDGKAQAKKATIVNALTMENWSKDIRVVPYLYT